MQVVDFFAMNLDTAKDGYLREVMSMHHSHDSIGKLIPQVSLPLHLTGCISIRVHVVEGALARSLAFALSSCGCSSNSYSCSMSLWCRPHACPRSVMSEHQSTLTWRQARACKTRQQVLLTCMSKPLLSYAPAMYLKVILPQNALPQAEACGTLQPGDVMAISACPDPTPESS